MIAPEYFNNHVAVEGEIIVKSVPNDAGFVLVWNPTTKKISRRTHAEIAADLGLVTANNEAFFNRNRIRSETISSVPVSLDAYLPQGGFISSYNTSSWGGSDRPINASYGGYIKFSDGNNDFNNLELYYNNGHNTLDTHKLWFRTKNNLGSTNWFEAYHSGNFNPGDYWEKLTTGFRGINDNDSRNFSFLSDNGSIAKKINTGGLLVSDTYSNETYVPVNGIWSKGNMQSNSRVVSSREGFFGAYDYTQTQGVWSIGESFNVNSNGSTTDLGNQYGMAYSYINVGGSSFTDAHQIHFVSNGQATVSVDTSYGRIRANEYHVLGGNSTQFLKADGSLDSTSYVTSTQLSDYVTINTPQEIEARKIFRPGIGNRYDEASLELRGSNASSVYPTISFHQPGLYAGTISLRNSNQFSFRNTDDSDFVYLNSKGYIKSGSDNNYLLLGGGDHKSISDFALSTDLTGYVRTTGDQNIDGIKGFTGAYTQWILNGDPANARGFVQSASGGFLAGTLNDSHVVFYRNSSEKIIIANNYTQFIDRISSPFLTILQSDLSPYGNYVGLESSSQDGNRIYLGGVADTVGSYIGQAKYVTSNQYQSNKSYASFIKFGNDGSTTFYGNIGLIPDTNYDPTELVKITQDGYLLSDGFIKRGSDNNYLLLAGGSHKPVSDFATSADLTNYVTINTPQTIIADKTFAPTASLTFSGNDVNSIKSFAESNGNVGIVAGWVYRHYSTFWKTGNKRGGNTDSLGYAFQFSTDDVNYDEKVLIRPDGYIVTNGLNSNNLTGGQMLTSAGSVLYVSNQSVATYLQSNGGLYHSTPAGTYDIWTAQNYNPANYVTKTLVINDNFDSVTEGGFYRANNQGSGVKYLYSPMLHLPGQDTSAQLQIRHNDGGSGTGELNYRGGYNGIWGAWRTAWDNINLPNPVNQGHLANYVDLSSEQNITGVKNFFGAYSRYILDGDANANALGIIQSTDSRFVLGTFNAKPTTLYYNGGVKVWIDSNLTTFTDNIAIPNAIQNNHAVNLGQLNSQIGNYLQLSGGTLTGGGRIDSVGNITVQQTDVGGNATGVWWDKVDDTDKMAGIGALTDNGNLNYLYMGWGTTPWASHDSFSVNENFIRYKENDIWHAGNFNPSTKINALENAKAIGFSSGSYPTSNGAEYPYIYYDNGSTTSYVALATQEFTNTNYHKINNGFGLNNESDSNYNKSWFDYSWAGSGSPGSVINFSGLGGYYATELFGEYGNGGNRFGLRTRNGDAAQWNDPRWIWHSGNFNPSQYVTQSSINSQLANYATLNGVQTFTNTISFSQSPVIPNGTINSHAVNLGQLYYNDRNFITDSRGAVRPPSFYDDRFAQWDFQYTDDTQVTGDAWQGVLTVSKWETFDPSHRQEQILFTGDNLKRRTAIDDNTWGPEKTIWDSGNFTPANFATTSQLNDKVNKSGDTMIGALLIGNNNIGKQRVLHLAEPTYLDSYGFNFYTDTSTGSLTLHGLNNGLNNAAPILSANRANNFVGINKENATTELDVNGNITSNGFIKNNSSDDYFLMGGGGQLTKYSKDDSYVNSHRDFPDGTLITTNIDYSHSAGDSFLLEIKGNMYGGGLPMDTKVQGYIYADTIINQSGYSTYADLSTIIAMNINGNLCFWFPRLWYWQGFSVKVIATGGGGITTVNRVISIDNSAEPVGTKQVKIAVYTLSTQSWVNNQGFLTSANLNGYVTQSALNTQLGSYATLNGVQTFNNTNTFNQSPVIPNGTLGNHAVNLNQLLDVAPPYHWNYVGQPAITNRRVLREMTWNNYGNGHTIFDISSGTTPWGTSKSNVDAEQQWTPSYPTLVGGNGSETYGVRVDSARNADNLGGIPAGNYATQAWVNTNFIPTSHPVHNITQANINSWNAGTGGGSSHTHSNLSYLNNIDQYLGTGQAPQFSSVRLMNSMGYGTLALEEDYIGGEAGLVDLSNEVFYAGRINEYLKYGSSVNGFEGLNIHFDAKLLGIGREIGNDEDKVQLAGDLSVDTVDFDHNSRQLVLNPLYNADGDVRRSRNAHIYIVTRNPVRLPDKPILGQRIEIFNDSDSYIEVTHDNVGAMFKIPGFCKVTGIAANKGFKFDAKPVDTKQYDI